MKYKLTDETMIHDGITLHRIECVTAFGDVKIGDKGGWIESESNLSQTDDAWVYGNAAVYDYAKIYGNAKVYEDAWVCGNAKVYDYAEVYGDAAVYDYAEVYGDAKVYDYANVYGYAKVYGDAAVYDYAKLYGNAEVSKMEDYMVFQNTWSSGRYFTWTRSNNMWKVGCFYGTGEELIKKAYAESQQKGDCYKAVVDFVESIYKFIRNEDK